MKDITFNDFFYIRQTSKDMEEKIRLFEEQLNIKVRKILISGLTSAQIFGKGFARKGKFYKLTRKYVSLN